MERRAKAGEFRSNIELGGTGRAVALTEEFRAAAEKAAQVLHWRARRSLEDMCRDAWRWQQCGGE